MPITCWRRGLIAAAALTFLFVQAMAAAVAHDSWISRGSLRNGAGEWCCGDGDCALIDAGAVHATPAGYVVRGYGTLQGASPAGNVREFIADTVPYAEAQPSPDGSYWRCQRPDKSRRCFFAPPPDS